MPVPDFRFAGAVQTQCEQPDLGGEGGGGWDSVAVVVVGEQLAAVGRQLVLGHWKPVGAVAVVVVRRVL